MLNYCNEVGWNKGRSTNSNDTLNFLQFHSEWNRDSGRGYFGPHQVKSSTTLEHATRRSRCMISKWHFNRRRLDKFILDLQGKFKMLIYFGYLFFVFSYSLVLSHTQKIYSSILLARLICVCSTASLFQNCQLAWHGKWMLLHFRCGGNEKEHIEYVNQGERSQYQINIHRWSPSTRMWIIDEFEKDFLIDEYGEYYSVAMTSILTLFLSKFTSLTVCCAFMQQFSYANTNTRAPTNAHTISGKMPK